MADRTTTPTPSSTPAAAPTTPPQPPTMPSIISPTPSSYPPKHTTPLTRTSSTHSDAPLPSLVSPLPTPTSTPAPASAAPTTTPRNLLETLPTVTCLVRARIPTTQGVEVFLHLYQNSIDTKEHLAIVFGDHIRSRSLDAPRPHETELDRMIRGAYLGRLTPGRTHSGLSADAPPPPPPPAPPLVRIHSECYTGETAWSARCDCGEQLDEAARLMALDPAGGVIIYLRQEGRGIGLGEKLKAYNLQDLGNDTVQANLLLRHPADARSYGLATAMLMDLGLQRIRLLTNNPEKIVAVEGRGREVQVVERVPMVPLAWRGLRGGVTGKEVGEYLKTKITQMGHMLEMPRELERPAEKDEQQQQQDEPRTDTR